MSPSPVYTLELLARGWRYITPKVLESFIPMSTGGVVKVSNERLWAPGSICYNNGVWYVQAESLNSFEVPHEKPTVNCYHTGTLGAYVRLNNLKVYRVQSDNYCGFHTVAMLVGGYNGKIDHRLRRTLAGKTAKYMIDNISITEIRVYLNMNNIYTQETLTNNLMHHNRWLSVEEVTFMLKAHSKLSAMITENSYPIYNPECIYFLIKAHHYEPVMHV